ncbi:vacuolar iron transporter homolog 1-like [Camellia sinensis]|uniref:vacuolar iron transporter homolog 1-like n=1 Tax=Camellia sinensis TaxID=4442 RepID=UPI001035EC8E|nr:vacuolar iron transporter homolog 1-like [Camellia sinensis]
MACDPQTLDARAEHKLEAEDKKEARLKRLQRAQWLRAAILGANDGLLSTTSLMLGVGAAKEDQRSMILSGLAGAVAGACSMAVGEFVSVSTQRDIEKETLCHSSKTEQHGEENGGEIKLHITTSPNGTTVIDTNPGRTSTCKKMACDVEQSLEQLSPTVSQAMTLGRKSPIVVASAKSPVLKVIAQDAKEELEQGEERDYDKKALPNPYGAAVASALSFLSGSVVPLIPALLVAQNIARVVAIVVVTSIALAVFGGVGAWLGGSSIRKSSARVLFGGLVTMGLTYGLLKPLYKERKSQDTD